MDPGTALAVVQICTAVLSHTYKYCSSVQGAKSEIERLDKEVKALQELFERLSELLERQKSSGTANVERLQTSRSLIESTEYARSDLQRLQQKLRIRSPQKVMSKVGLRALQWPLKKQDVDEYVARLERYKASVRFALQLDQTSLLLDAHGNLRSVKQQQSQTEVDRQLSKLPIAQDAAFNSFRWQHAAYCLADTRVALLDHINRWSNEQGPHIFWLSGVAGSGKSTIARTIASEFSKQGCLGASFFFSQGGGDLGHAGKFVTTLARQLVESRRDLRSCLSAAISTQESVIHQGLRDQWKAFVLGPLSELQRNSANTRRLIFVVDAMDECDQEDDIKLILQLFRELQPHQNGNLRLCVTSRPETYIRLGFSSMPEILHKDLNLGSVPRDIFEHDISVFLKHELHRLGEKYALLDWPSDVHVSQLVQKCDLLFIYATTICRFIDDEIDRPTERLSMILQDIPAEEPLLSSLDEMYIKILKHCITRNRSGTALKRAVQRFQSVVGSFIILFSTLSMSAISVLLETDIDEVKVSFDPLHSLIYIPPELDRPLHALHPSFRDFLVNKSRCSEDYFHIQPKIAHIRLTRCCLHLLGGFLRKDMCNLKNPGSLTREVQQDVIRSCFPEHVQYACRYWIDHLSQVNGGERHEAGLYENGEIYNFLRMHFLHWLEAMSLLGKMSECVKLTAKLKSLHTRLDRTRLWALLDDANRFVLSHSSMIEVAPLQAYIGALIFSPSKSIVRELSEQGIPDWIILKPKVPDEWGALLQTLEGHSDSVYSVAFSPDGQKIVSGSYDRTVRVWETASGSLLQTLEGHSDSVGSIAMSLEKPRRTISVSDCWILVGQVRTVFLPENRRALGCASSDGKLVIGSSSGIITIFHFDLNSI